MVKIDSVLLQNAAKPKDSDDYFEFAGSADNHVFRLERVDLDTCKSLMRDGDEVAALPPE